MSSSPLPADELAALADKYQALADLRAHRDSGGETSRDPLRQLARRFPGALRELDTLGLVELRRRAAVARAAITGGPIEPWLPWIVAFHRLLAAALLIKSETAARARGLEVVQAEETLLRRASQLAGVTLDEPQRQAFARPVGGRLTPLVLAALAHRFERPPGEIEQALFPSRRRFVARPD